VNVLICFTKENYLVDVLISDVVDESAIIYVLDTILYMCYYIIYVLLYYICVTILYMCYYIIYVLLYYICVTISCPPYSLSEDQ